MQTLDELIAYLELRRKEMDEAICAAWNLKKKLDWIESWDAKKEVAASKDRLPLLPDHPSMGKPKKASLADRAFEMMPSDKAMKTVEILNVLAACEYHVGGKKPLATLYSALIRSKKVRRTADGSWIPVKVK